MNRLSYPTPYHDVNAVIDHFRAHIEAILGGQFVGMYLYGSLALGDFDPQESDIDFIVVTDGEIVEERFAALREMHEQMAASASPWAGKIEAAYIPLDTLQHSAPTSIRYPQLEKGGTLSREPLEIGWAFQRHAVREYGIVVSGPDPRTLTDPVDPEEMRQAVRAITEMWLQQAQHDPSWIEWLRQRDAQSFVVLTLCRCLYALDMKTVASKPAAARWALAALNQRWSGLIKRAMAGQRQTGETPERDINETVTLLQYTVERSQQRGGRLL
jgi:hypothetical protein